MTTVIIPNPVSSGQISITPSGSQMMVNSPYYSGAYTSASLLSAQDAAIKQNIVVQDQISQGNSELAVPTLPAAVKTNLQTWVTGKQAESKQLQGIISTTAYLNANEGQIKAQVLANQSSAQQVQVGNTQLSTQTSATVPLWKTAVKSTSGQAKPKSVITPTLNPDSAKNIKSPTVVTPAPVTQELNFVPSPNILHDYSTYTYGITWSVLNPNDYNLLIDNNASATPAWQYTTKNVLVSSAGRFEDVRAVGFKNTDYFFSGLTMETIVGLNASSRMTNAITLDFTIVEPYGVSLLKNMVNMAATLNIDGDYNHLKLPYVLQIDFFGADSTGNIKQIKDITKIIPITILSLDIKVTSRGSEYHITAVPYAHSAFSESAVSTPCLIEVSASTVGGFFASTTTDYSSQFANQANNQRAATVLSQTTNDRNGSVDPALQQAGAELNNTTVNASSFADAINGYLAFLKQSGQVNEQDKISFVIDPEIASAALQQPIDTNKDNTPMDAGSDTSLVGTSNAPSSVSNFTWPNRDASMNPVGLPSVYPSLYSQNTYSAEQTRQGVLEQVARQHGIVGINLAIFIAQCAWESGHFGLLDTYANNKLQLKASLPAKDTSIPGEAWYTYRPRGYIQLYGEENYKNYSNKYGIPNIHKQPDLAASDLQVAALVAVAYWKTRTVKGTTLFDLGNSASLDQIDSNFLVINTTTGIFGNATQAAANVAERNKLFLGYLEYYKVNQTPSAMQSNTSPTSSTTGSVASAQSKKTATNATAAAAGKPIMFPVNPGSNIIDIIHEVIRNSAYITKQIKLPGDEDPTPDVTAVLKWFKIIPQLKILKFDAMRNSFAKEITYHIVKFSTNNKKIPEANQGQLTKYAKEYDYYFTGKNSDVMDLALDFNLAYYISRSTFATNPSLAVPGTQSTNAKNKALTANSPIINTATSSTIDNSKKYQTVQTGFNPAQGNSQMAKQYIASDLSRALLIDSRGDMINVDLKIIGDPDFIKQDDVFYLNPRGPTTTPNLSLVMDQQSLLVKIVVHSIDKTDDYSPTGVEMPSAASADSVFTGLYMVLSVNNEFRNGEFTQTLNLIRHGDDAAVNTSTNTRTTQGQTGLGARQ